MPFPRIIVQIRHIVESNVDIARTAVETSISVATERDRVKDWPRKVAIPTSEVLRRLDVRYPSATEADKAWNALKRDAAIFRTNVSGVMSRHDCYHLDAADHNCRDDSRSNYEEVAI